MDNTLRKAAEMALDALELECTDINGNKVDLVNPAIEALRQALAQQTPDEFCTATTEELMKVIGCSDQKAKEIHDGAEALAKAKEQA